MASIQNIHLSFNDTTNPAYVEAQVTYDLTVSNEEAQRLAAYREEIEFLAEDFSVSSRIFSLFVSDWFRPAPGTQHHTARLLVLRSNLAEDPDPPRIPPLPPPPKNLDEIRVRVRLHPYGTPSLDGNSQLVQKHFG